MIKGPEMKPCEEHLSELGTLSVNMRTLRGDNDSHFQIEDGAGLFSAAPEGNGYTF